ncbi:hypothetical protein J1605_012957 [Eschrichtius robustus]|uniref:Basic proline-rich protein-like n=1 Tax=Eschrichtius robustus TaxID=9764 RepID=A0AB34GJW2_ESCRO|nr:hypothetical protein J1605_012957 [Eschrichtius robustus]
MRPCPQPLVPKAAGPHCARSGPGSFTAWLRRHHPAGRPAPPPRLAHASREARAGPRRGRGGRLRPGFVRAPRPPAALDPARHPPAPRGPAAPARGPQPTFWMVCCVTSPLPLGRADAKATDMVVGAGSTRDHRGLFSGCSRRPEALILRSRWGAGGVGGAAPWARPPLRRRVALGPAAPPPRPSPQPEDEPHTAPPGGRSAPRSRPAATPPPPAPGRQWFRPAPPRRARTSARRRLTPPDTALRRQRSRRRWGRVSGAGAVAS